MKNFELTLRTFLIILVTVLALQYAQQVSIKSILIIYAICIVGTTLNMILFKALGLLEK